jgi:hypothetical protein
MSQDVQNPPSTQDRPVKPEPARARGGLALSVLNLVVLLGSLGLLGYLIYERTQESKAVKPAEEDAKKAMKVEGELKPAVDHLQGEVKDLAKTVEERPSPPNYAPQIKAVEDRITDLGKSLADMTDRIDAIGKKVDGLDPSARFGAIEKQVAEVAGTLAAVKAELAAKLSPLAVASDEMGQAIALFKEGKWGDAKDAFTRLQGVSPDDARVWYFSALANGLASRDWKGESEKLVAEGMAREKAGKPDKAKIDAAFADLTTATGKDWLTFYRTRTASSPDSR